MSEEFLSKSRDKWRELPAGGDQQMLPQHLRSGEHEGHRILQLIAKAERAARLIKARPGPEP